jgi:methionine sulfoxide reductase heme-binding subunit
MEKQMAGASRNSNYREGWRLVALISAMLVVMTIGVAAVRTFDTDGIRMAVRYTARSSLVLFCLAFSARAMLTLFPSIWSRWQFRNRRYLGLSFAISHAMHAVAIVAFAATAPVAFAGATSVASYVFGGIGYAFIALMAATSFDRTAAAVGPRAWRALHLTGGYYLLVQFMISFGKRIPDMPLYGLFLIPLIVVFVLRMVAMSRRPSGALTPSTL